MAIHAPKWCPYAIPSKKGWEHPHTGEVLKSANHSVTDIQEWYAAKASTVQVEAPRTLHEAPSVERSLSQSEQQHYGFSSEEE